MVFNTEKCGLPANYFEDNRKYKRTKQKQVINEKRLSLGKTEIRGHLEPEALVPGNLIDDSKFIKLLLDSLLSMEPM